MQQRRCCYCCRDCYCRCGKVLTRGTRACLGCRPPPPSPLSWARCAYAGHGPGGRRGQAAPGPPPRCCWGRPGWAGARGTGPHTDAPDTVGMPCKAQGGRGRGPVRDARPQLAEVGTVRTKPTALSCTWRHPVLLVSLWNETLGEDKRKLDQSLLPVHARLHIGARAKAGQKETKKQQAGERQAPCTHHRLQELGKHDASMSRVGSATGLPTTGSRFHSGGGTGGGHHRGARGGT